VGDIPPHISCLHDTGERRKTACGREIEIWALAPKKDAAVLSAWARHFREHYIADLDLPAMVDGTEFSNAQYLRDVLFPDASKTPGPSAATDFPSPPNGKSARSRHPRTVPHEPGPRALRKGCR
jgi:hypothetical protein